MKVNIEALKELLDSAFGGNQTAFSESLGIERTHVNKVFKNNGKGAGANFCGAVIKYCKDNDLNYEKYIFLN